MLPFHFQQKFYKTDMPIKISLPVTQEAIQQPDIHPVEPIHPVRPIRSYVKRVGRVSSGQARALENLSEHLIIPFQPFFKRFF